MSSDTKGKRSKTQNTSDGTVDELAGTPDLMTNLTGSPDDRRRSSSLTGSPDDR